MFFSLARRFNIMPFLSLSLLTQQGAMVLDFVKDVPEILDLNVVSYWASPDTVNSVEAVQNKY